MLRLWVMESSCIYTYTKNHEVSFWNSLDIWPFLSNLPSFYYLHNLKSYKVNTFLTLTFNRIPTWFINPNKSETRRLSIWRWELLTSVQYNQPFVSSQLMDRLGWDIKTQCHPWRKLHFWDIFENIFNACLTKSFMKFTFTIERLECWQPETVHSGENIL